ncbi:MULTISPECIES: hypothetical protein [unclassified Cryobacterium]|uniref:hypothetical protein n=1 Tax=unclassified Cryobacterium TaxID=2649013 RepID=UPI000CE4FE31|nr:MULTISPECIES: hypothetical protein [unclassified Cryobacterium]
MTEERVVSLLTAAREHYAVPAATTLMEGTTLLETWGGIELPFDRFAANLFDEFVDASLATSMFTILDAPLLKARATAEERHIFSADPDEPFDPNEYGADQADWTTYSHQMETLQRAIIILEAAPAEPDRVGNFRVYGAAQWLRESLWAATGIAPRDSGSPDANSSLFGEAFTLAERDPFAAAPI